MKAYEECLSATSTRDAPWYVVPADDKENARLIVSQIVLDTFEGLENDLPEDEPQSAGGNCSRSASGSRNEKLRALAQECPNQREDDVHQHPETCGWDMPERPSSITSFGEVCRVVVNGRTEFEVKQSIGVAANCGTIR